MAHILHTAQAAAHADRDIDIVHGFAHDVAQIIAVVKAGHDVDVEQFIDALLVVFFGKPVGVTQLAQSLQLDALDQVGVFDIQPGNQAYFFSHNSRSLYFVVGAARVAP